MMGWMAPLRHRGAKLVFLEKHQDGPDAILIPI